MDDLVFHLFHRPEPGYQEIPQYWGSLMRITVSGLPGSGTTSLSRYLAQRHNFTMISAGEVFRECAQKHNLELAEFGKLAEQDPTFDKMIDARQKEIAEEKDNIIVEGRLSGWMVEKADLKIWLFAPINCRIDRIVYRDQIADDETAKKITLERERCEAGRYSAYYNIDINDLSIYHIILNSEQWGVEDLGAIVDTAIGQLTSYDKAQ
jgi:cytidylate kinase